MTLDLDTFLVALYTIIDDLYLLFFKPHKPKRPGPEPLMSDSEVLTLMALIDWDTQRSQRTMLGRIKAHWSDFFPTILSQSRFNKRARDLAGTLAMFGPLVAQQLEHFVTTPGAAYEVLDCSSVELMKRCRGQHAKLFSAEQADIGRGGVQRTYYYGIKLLVSINNLGLLTGFVYAPASCEDRWLAEGLFRFRWDANAPAPSKEDVEDFIGRRKWRPRKGPSGRIWGAAGQRCDGPYLADLGFDGKTWQQHWEQHYRAQVITNDRFKTQRDEARLWWCRWQCSHRQKVETGFSLLKENNGLGRVRSRSEWGLAATIGAMLLAFNMTRLLNLITGRAVFESIDPWSLKRAAA